MQGGAAVAMPRRRKRLRAPGGGRKPLPPGQKRDRLISVRTTPALGEAIDRAARDEGMTISDWMVAAAELAIARGSTR